jgi:hypothetical protein
LIAQSQIEQSLKFELLIPVRSELENLLMMARQDTARFCCGV